MQVCSDKDSQGMTSARTQMLSEHGIEEMNDFLGKSWKPGPEDLVMPFWDHDIYW